MIRCVNIDWLELYCLESPNVYPCNAEFFRRQGYDVRERDYGTRQYREMFTIIDRDGLPWIEIRRNPVAGEDAKGVKGMFNPYSCHIRLSNVACYSNEPVIKLEDFLFQFQYDVSRIFRLDICLDFERFDKGDDPSDVLNRYLKGKYTKINQSNISAHGRDLWDGRKWNSVSWGNPKSMVSTKMYNKTMELQTAKDKPYIRYAWQMAGLVDDYINLTKSKANGSTYKPEIWRVEFSLKSSARAWYVIEDNTHRKVKQVALPHSLTLYETREQLLTAFASLSHHYFHFKHYQANRRKDRCQDKVLFVFDKEDTVYKIDRLITDRPRNNADDTLKARLEQYREHRANKAIYDACQTIIDSITDDQLGASLVHFSAEEIRILRRLINLRTPRPTNSYDDDLKTARADAIQADIF